MSPADPDYYPRIKIDGETYLIADDLDDLCRHCAFFNKSGLGSGGPTDHCTQMKLSTDNGRELFERHDCEAAGSVFIKPDKLPEYVAIAIGRRME